MKLLPIKDFWDHVFIVYSWSNPNDNNFINYKEGKPVNFMEKIMKSKNLINFMNEKKIAPPTSIEEFYIDSITGSGIPQVEQEFIKIKNKIYETEFMFPEVRRGVIETNIKNSQNKGFIKIQKHQIVTIRDFDGRVRR